MKIGIMGGTFDPIHYGHLYIAEYVREECHLDYIVFMPAGDTPHKDTKLITDKELRYKMTECAVHDNEYFKVSDIEIKKQGRSYTVETAKILKEKFSEDDIYFIIGADSADSIEKWHKFRELLDIAKFIVVPRSGVSVDGLRSDINRYIRDYDADMVLVSAPLYELSSTMIRDFVSLGRSIKYMTPDSVIDIIGENHLYE